MKFWFPALALVATVSLPALAQEVMPPDAMHASGDAAARPTTEQMEAMQKLHEQMRQIHTQARLQMLGSLSAAHRNALANIIGQLAIAPNPEPRAAEVQIDALLGANEKQAVLAAEAIARTSSRALMESVRAKIETGASADDRAKMQARDAARAAHESQDGTAPAPDAGRTLLRVSAMGFEGPGGGHMMEFVRGMGPGGRSN